MVDEFYPKELDLTVERLWGRNVPGTPDSYGIEIEAEGVPPGGLDWMRYLPGVWQTHADNSLRDGIEFVSNGARALTDIPADMDALQTALTTLQYTPVFSYRTSLHVHMNANDLTVRQLMNLFTLYTIYETPLVAFGGEERRGNVHCLTVHDTNATLQMIRGWLMGQSQLTGLVHRDRRYAAFNWASLPVHGTIEFRSHRGTADRDTVVRWATILSDLKRAAKVFGNPQEIVQEFSRMGPEQFAESVFTNSKEFLATLSGFGQEIWEGVRLAQEVAFARSEWSKPKKSGKSKELNYNMGSTATAIDILAGRAGRQRRPAEALGDGQVWGNWNLAEARAEAAAGLNPQRPIRATVFDEEGFDTGGFDRDGFDAEGFDREGFSEEGFDRDGQHRDDL